MVPWPLVRVLPKRLVTGFVGWLARRRLSRWRIRAYARKYGCDLSELDRDLGQFNSLQEFFSRPLKEGVRPLGGDPLDLLSPVDGRIQQQGLVQQGSALQIKGHEYSVADLLGGDAIGLEGGHYFVLYLAPGDYHRIHSPVSGSLVGARHLPGSLWPLNQTSVRRLPSLYVRNERMVIELARGTDHFWLVLVGATVVGRIRLAHDTGFGSRRRRRAETTYQHQLERGGLLGWFETGSTVIVLSGPGMVEPVLEIGHKIRMGEVLARWKSDFQFDP